jgi:tetratricopeptide (TPR) repeat protein
MKTSLMSLPRSLLLIGVVILGSNFLLPIMYFYSLIGGESAGWVKTLLSFLSIAAMFPFEFIYAYLKGNPIFPLVWVSMVTISVAAMFWLTSWARKIFIVMGVVHVTIMGYLTFMKYGQPGFLDYFFKCYFHMVVTGAYIGLLTTPDIRARFVIIPRSADVSASAQPKKGVPPDAKGYHNLGQAYVKLQRDTDAIQSFQKAIAISPHNPDFQYELGMAYLRERNYPEAIRALKEALRLKPGYPAALYHLGIVYQQEGCYQQAIEVFEQVVEAMADNHHLFELLGKSYLACGRHKDAVKAFQKASELNPTNNDAYYQIGYILLSKLDKYQHAEEALRKSIQLRPDFADAHFQFGLACIKLNHYKDAIRAFKEVIRLEEDHAQAHYHLGFTYAMIKDFPSAQREYERLKQIDQDLAETLLMLLK